MQTAAATTPRRSLPKFKTEHVAFYEDAAKVEAAAKAKGFTGADGESWHDYVESHNDKFNTVARFPTLREAVSWLRGEVKAYKTVFGAGTIRLVEIVERPDQCRYCVCSGRRATHEWIVTDDGIESDDAIDNNCAD